MLSFDFYEGNDWVGIEYMISKLNHFDIASRMLDNLKVGGLENSVLKNHIRYLSKNKVKESYPKILDEILNTKRKEYQRKEFLLDFFSFTKDKESLKSIVSIADSEIRWSIIELLIANNEEGFAETYLLNKLQGHVDPIEKGRTIEVLVSLQNVEGFKAFVEWVKNSEIEDLDTSKILCLNRVNSKGSVPYLMDLLELSYKKGINPNAFYQINSQILGALHNVAMVSEENFVQVKSCLENFLNENISIHNNVKYLLHTIERLEDQFYSTRSRSFTIKQVKEKLLLLK